MTGAASSALPASVHRTVLLLSLACFCSMATQRICDAMLPELAREFGASMAYTAQVVSLFALVYGLAQLFYGALGDRCGKMRVISFTTLASGAGSLVAVFATQLDLLIGARMLVALFTAAIIPMALAWTGDAVPYEQRQETLARVGLGTTLGIVGGQLLGGLFTDTIGWRWAFLLMTVLFLGVGWLLRDSLRSQPATEAASGSTDSMWVQLRRILSVPWGRRFLALSVLQGAGGFGTVSIVATHLHGTHGMSLSTAGAVVALFGLGGVMYMSVARHLIKRLGEQGMALVGGGSMGGALLLVGLSPWWQLSPLAMLIGGFGFFMLHNTLQAHATQLAPQARGLGVSLFATSLFLGQSIGVMLAGQSIDRLGSGIIVASGGLMLIAVAVGVCLQLRRPQT